MSDTKLGQSYQSLQKNIPLHFVLYSTPISSAEVVSRSTMPKVPFAFRGLIAPVFTPFNNDSSRTLNLSIIPSYADYLAKKRVTGVLINGTTGEGASMSVAERKLVAEAWAKAVRITKQHLMVQIGGAPLIDVLELAKHAESIKADSILCLPELYFKPTTSEQLTEYLKLVGQAAPSTALLYYHIPMFTNVNVHMGECLESLGEKLPTFVGIKFTSPNLEEGARALHAGNRKYVIFLGNDQLIGAACALGMDSVIATSINMLPELTQEILALGKTGNSIGAREKQERLSKAVVAISRHGNWVETMKVAMSLLTNVDAGPVRAPLKVLSPEITATMASELRGLGLQVTK